MSPYISLIKPSNTHFYHTTQPLGLYHTHLMITDQISWWYGVTAGLYTMYCRHSSNDGVSWQLVHHQWLMYIRWRSNVYSQSHIILQVIYCMAGNFSVQLNLVVVGKINRVSPVFIPPTLNTSIINSRACLSLLKCDE